MVALFNLPLGKEDLLVPSNTSSDDQNQSIGICAYMARGIQVSVSGGTVQLEDLIDNIDNSKCVVRGGA
jgi:hypothetical protein